METISEASACIWVSSRVAQAYNEETFAELRQRVEALNDHKVISRKSLSGKQPYYYHQKNGKFHYEDSDEESSEEKCDKRKRDKSDDEKEVLSDFPIKIATLVTRAIDDQEIRQFFIDFLGMIFTESEESIENIDTIRELIKKLSSNQLSQFYVCFLEHEHKKTQILLEKEKNANNLLHIQKGSLVAELQLLEGSKQETTRNLNKRIKEEIYRCEKREEECQRIRNVLASEEKKNTDFYNDAKDSRKRRKVAEAELDRALEVNVRLKETNKQIVDDNENGLMNIKMDHMDETQRLENDLDGYHKKVDEWNEKMDHVKSESLKQSNENQYLRECIQKKDSRGKMLYRSKVSTVYFGFKQASAEIIAQMEHNCKDLTPDQQSAMMLPAINMLIAESLETLSFDADEMKKAWTTVDEEIK